jgi:hypothetical protein
MAATARSAFARRAAASRLFAGSPDEHAPPNLVEQAHVAQIVVLAPVSLLVPAALSALLPPQPAVTATAAHGSQEGRCLNMKAHVLTDGGCKCSERMYRRDAIMQRFFTSLRGFALPVANQIDGTGFSRCPSRALLRNSLGVWPTSLRKNRVK